MAPFAENIVKKLQKPDFELTLSFCVCNFLLFYCQLEVNVPLDWK